MKKKITLTFVTTLKDFIKVNGDITDEKIIKNITEKFEEEGYEQVEVNVENINFPLPNNTL
jgi:hypothetical protein